MSGSDDPAFVEALSAANERVQQLYAELHDAYPPFRGNLAISGVFVGYGLGAFVANGMPDDQIVAHVLDIVAQIRQSFGTVQPEAPDDAPDDSSTVH